MCVEIVCVRASFHTCSLFQCPTPTEEERHCWRVLALHCRGVVSTRERTWRHLSPPRPHLRDVGILTGQWRSQERKRSKNNKTVQIFYAVFGSSLASWWLLQTNIKSYCIVTRVRILWNLVPRLSYSLELVSSVPRVSPHCNALLRRSKNNFIQYRPTANCQINDEIYIQSFDIDQNKTGDKTIRNS